jgi:hypothetical protein
MSNAADDGVEITTHTSTTEDNADIHSVASDSLGQSSSKESQSTDCLAKATHTLKRELACEYGSAPHHVFPFPLQHYRDNWSQVQTEVRSWPPLTVWIDQK